jgi:hypothetical protein
VARGQVRLQPLWQMSVLGLRHASFLFNCDLAEVGLFGFPPFKGCSRPPSPSQWPHFYC